MAFKESATGKWTAQWYETDVYGNRKQVKSVVLLLNVRQSSMK